MEKEPRRLVNCATLAIFLVSLVLIYAIFFPSEVTIFESGHNLLAVHIYWLLLPFFCSFVHI